MRNKNLRFVVQTEHVIFTENSGAKESKTRTITLQ